MRIADTELDFRNAASDGVLPCQYSAAPPPSLPHGPVDAYQFRRRRLKGAAHDTSTINKPEEEDSTCFEEF